MGGDDHSSGTGDESASDSRAELSETLLDVRNAQRGDADAWASLDQRCRRWISAKLRRRRLPAHVDVEDVVQLVLQDVFTGFDRFEVRPGAMFWAWLNRITENRIVDLRRWCAARKRKDEVRFRDYYESSVIEPDVAGREASQSAVMRYHEAEAKYSEAIERLPQVQRAVMRLREIEGLSYAEIASRLELDNIDSIRVLCHRARERVRELMRPFRDHPSSD